jgi:esterase
MKLYFQKLGQGPALIILHGLYGSSDNWVTIARKLSSHYTIYLVDQRNHGRSPHSSEHTFEGMAADVDELMTSENIEKAYILGHSMGGKTAMLFAALHPDKLLGLIIVDIYPGGYAELLQHSPQVIAHLNIVTTMLSIDMNDFSKRADIETELAKTIKDLSVRQFIMKNLHRNPDNTFSWKLNISVISKALPLIMGPIPLNKILDFKTLTLFPVLFMKGEHSSYIGPNQIAEIKKYFPKAQIQTIAGAGHWVHADNPDQFMLVLEEFLNNN